MGQSLFSRERRLQGLDGTEGRVQLANPRQEQLFAYQWKSISTFKRANIVNEPRNAISESFTKSQFISCLHKFVDIIICSNVDRVPAQQEDTQKHAVHESVQHLISSLERVHKKKID